MKSDLVDVSVIMAHKTPKAILVKEAEDVEGVWLPLSQIEYDPPDARIGTIISITLPEWLALGKGLI